MTGKGSLCRFCGRSKCRCGEPYPSRKCPRHGAKMKIVSIASRSPIPGQSQWGWNWFEAILCNKCDFMRPLKHGQGVPRNENRKTNSVPSKSIYKNKAGVEIIRTKFGAQIRAMVELKTPSQEKRGLPVRSDAVQRAPYENDKDTRQTARSLRCSTCGIIHGGPCAPHVNKK